ncbi:hypothetical protein Tco_0998400 [Tanacetum coccineum]
MLGKIPNKVYDPFLKTGLGYQNPKRLKKAIATQPKMYHGEMLQSTNLKFDLPDSEETLEDAEESQLKMRNKMIQLDFGKLNALYETFVPKKEPSVEQTYFSIPSTSNIIKEMDDSQNSLKEFYKTDVIPMSESLTNTLKELQQELVEECSKDIQANLLNIIKILENDFKRSQAQSIDFELELQLQKEKMACDVSWKSRLSKLNDENVLIKTQVDSVVQERENIKLEYQKLCNSIKATWAQHQEEVNELIESTSQKTYAYGDVCFKNQDLLMVISELKDKLKTFDKGKGVNTNSNSVRLPKSKDTKSKNRVLKNTNDKSLSAHVQKVSSSVRIDSNKCETMNSDESQSNTSVLNTKTVDVVNGGSNIVFVSCGKDVFMLSHEKCVARYALSIDSRVIQLVLWIADSWCSKHMTGNLKILRNFIEKFMGIIRFGNDHFVAITGYGDYVQGNITICHVYYNLKGDDLLIGSRDSNLYTISISELAASSPVCLMSKATSTKLILCDETPEVTDNSAANTFDNEDTPSSSSIVIE